MHRRALTGVAGWGTLILLVATTSFAANVGILSYSPAGRVGQLSAFAAGVPNPPPELALSAVAAPISAPYASDDDDSSSSPWGGTRSSGGVFVLPGADGTGGIVSGTGNGAGRGSGTGSGSGNTSSAGSSGGSGSSDSGTPAVVGEDPTTSTPPTPPDTTPTTPEVEVTPPVTVVDPPSDPPAPPADEPEAESPNDGGSGSAPSGGDEPSVDPGDGQQQPGGIPGGIEGADDDD